MRLRFLEVSRAPCARTVAGSSTVVIGGHEWREVEEQEAAQDLPADGRAARRRERGVARPLMQACGVATCCWAVRSDACGRCVTGSARRERCRHRESGAFKAVCGRARALVAVADTNKYCAGQQTDKLARPMGNGYGRKAKSG